MRSGENWIQTAGYNPLSEASKLFYDPTISCGHIKNGIALRHGDRCGAFVVGLEDLERACREVREAHYGNEHHPVMVFAKKILHGSPEHKEWLLEAAKHFCRGERIPEPRK